MCTQWLIKSCIAAIFCNTCCQYAASQEIEITLPMPPVDIDADSTQTFIELRNGITKWFSAIKAIDITYSEINVGSRVPDPVPALTKHHFAYKGEKRLKHMKIVTADNPDNPGWFFAFNGDVEQQYNATFAEATLTENKQTFLDRDGYCYTLGIALTDDDRAILSKSFFFLPAVLHNPKLSWTVESKMQRVADFDCHVLVENLSGQRIWVDAKNNFRIIRRSIFHAIEDCDVEDYPMAYLYQFGAWKPLGSGEFLPHAVSVVRFITPNAPKKSWNKPVLKSTYEVTAASINDKVLPEIFDPNFPAGTLVRDMRITKMFRVGGDGQMVEQIIGQAQADLELDGVSSSWRWKIIYVNIILIAIFVSVIALKRIRAS